MSGVSGSSQGKTYTTQRAHATRVQSQAGGIESSATPSQGLDHNPLFHMPSPPPPTARARPIQYSIPLRGQLQRVDCSTGVRLWG